MIGTTTNKKGSNIKEYFLHYYKMIINTKLLNAALLLPLLCVLIACCDKEHELTQESQNIFSYEFVCSSDLFQFVVPHASFTDNNGEQQNITLSENDFELRKIKTRETLQTKINIGTDTISITSPDSIEVYIWGHDIAINASKHEMTISYNIKDDIYPIDNNMYFYLGHGLIGNYSTIADTDLQLTNVAFIPWDEVEKYLSELSKETDYKQIVIQ